MANRDLYPAFDILQIFYSCWVPLCSFAGPDERIFCSSRPEAERELVFVVCIHPTQTPVRYMPQSVNCFHSTI